MLRFFVDLQDKTADDPPVFPDPVSRAAVDAVFYRFPGNDLAVFLKMIVPPPEFLHRANPECALVVENELFPVLICEPGEGFEILVTAHLWQRSDAFEILGMVPYEKPETT